MYCICIYTVAMYKTYNPAYTFEYLLTQPNQINIKPIQILKMESNLHR